MLLDPTSVLVFHNDAILFAGPLAALGWHRHAAPAIICGLERPVTVETARGITRFAAAFVPPGLNHAPDFANGRAAVLYLQPGSAWAQRAIAAYSATDLVDLEPHTGWHQLFADCADLAPSAIGRHLEFGIAVCLAPLAHNARLDSRVVALMNSGGTGPAGSIPALSASRLRHLFVETLGVPQRRYKVWLRLQHAVATALTGQSLTGAAHDAGFSDSAHFSRAFRNMFGLAPSSVITAGLQFGDFRGHAADGVDSGQQKPSL